jgi:hypothetical protein
MTTGRGSIQMLSSELPFRHTHQSLPSPQYGAGSLKPTRHANFPQLTQPQKRIQDGQLKQQKLHNVSKIYIELLKHHFSAQTGIFERFFTTLSPKAGSVLAFLKLIACLESNI